MDLWTSLVLLWNHQRCLRTTSLSLIETESSAEPSLSSMLRLQSSSLRLLSLSSSTRTPPEFDLSSRHSMSPLHQASAGSLDFESALVLDSVLDSVLDWVLDLESALVLDLESALVLDLESASVSALALDSVLDSVSALQSAAAAMQRRSCRI